MREESNVCEGYALQKNTLLEEELAEFFDWLDDDVLKKEDLAEAVEKGILGEDWKEHCAEGINLFLDSCYLAGAEDEYDVETIAFEGKWNKKKIREIGTSDVKNLVTVDGKVQSRSGKKEHKYEVWYKCENSHKNDVRQPVTGGELKEPSRCIHEDCYPKNWKMGGINATEDRREVMLQGLHSEVDNPDKIRVILEGRFVNEVEAGDKVRMNCVVRREKREAKYSDLVLYCVGIEKEDELDLELEEDEVEEFEEKAQKDMLEYLAPCVAPNLVGKQYESVRKGVLLQLFAGEFDHMDSRDTSHILLAGDPSVGKSDILEWVNEVAPTSQSVGGENATVVGLTGGVKDGSEFKSSSWRVTSGAMAKANKGTCCVDEIDKMGEKEQKALNNVLSNQVVNITKIVNAEIKAETNALMACNPSDGRIIDKLPIDEQLPFHYTFFPRLDLIYIIRDKVQSKEEHKNGGGTQREKKGWISKYVKYARKEYDPVLTDEAKDALLESFHDMRTHDNNERKIRVTRRYKDAIERLGRAHARLNLKDEVQPRDIDVALGLVEESLKRVGVMDDSVEFDIYSMETGLSEEEMEFLRFAEEYEKYGDFILDGQEEFGDSFDDLLERAKEKEELYIDEEKNLVKRKKTE